MQIATEAFVLNILLIQTIFNTKMFTIIYFQSYIVRHGKK